MGQTAHILSSVEISIFTSWDNTFKGEIARDSQLNSYLVYTYSSFLYVIYNTSTS